MIKSPGDALSPDADAAAGSWPRSWVWLLVGTALLVGLILRFVGLSYPPFDNHNYRQTQTLSTIENYHAQGIDLLHPKTIYMGDPGTFVLELPVFQALAALFYDIFGPHLEIIRILNILFGAATTWLLYKITDYFLGRATAILTALIYWLAPLNILYQRSMLLDPMAVFCALVAFYSLGRLLLQRDFTPRPGDTRVDWLLFTAFAIATWLTAMIKTLYLWPAVLLLAKVFFDQKFKLDAKMVRVLAVFAVSGICFLAWNYYATQINSRSPFTDGVRPTSHLGISLLFTTDFYCQLAPRPTWWVGGLGALLYPVGLWVAWVERRDRARAIPLWFLILVPPTYLLCFANINRPHDYYQLIIAPFLAIVPANGLRWLASRFLAAPEEGGLTRGATLKWRALVFGTLLYGVGLLWAWAKWHDPSRPYRFFLLFLIPPTYLLLFAGILVSPQGLTSARRAALRRTMLAGLGGFLVLASVLTYLVWLQQPHLNPQLLQFQKLCAGKVIAGRTAMVFVARSINGDPPDNKIPHYLYAARLWGYGKSVGDAAEARDCFEKLAPAFPKLEYVLFYGTECPDWLPGEQFHLTVRDDNDRLYVFQRASG